MIKIGDGRHPRHDLGGQFGQILGVETERQLGGRTHPRPVGPRLPGLETGPPRQERGQFFHRIPEGQAGQPEPQVAVGILRRVLGEGIEARPQHPARFQPTQERQHQQEFADVLQLHRSSIGKLRQEALHQPGKTQRSRVDPVRDHQVIEEVDRSLVGLR